MRGGYCSGVTGRRFLINRRAGLRDKRVPCSFPCVRNKKREMRQSECWWVVIAPGPIRKDQPDHRSPSKMNDDEVSFRRASACRRVSIVCLTARQYAKEIRTYSPRQAEALRTHAAAVDLARLKPQILLTLLNEQYVRRRLKMKLEL